MVVLFLRAIVGDDAGCIKDKVDPGVLFFTSQTRRMKRLGELTRLSDVLHDIEDAEKTMDYDHANRLVFRAFAMAQDMKFGTCIRFDDTIEDGEMWPVLVIEIPCLVPFDAEKEESQPVRVRTKQIAWLVKPGRMTYDGSHNETKEKYETRIPEFDRYCLRCHADYLSSRGCDGPKGDHV